MLEGLGGGGKATHNAASRRTVTGRMLKKGQETMHLGDPKHDSNSARDETVWFSFLAAGVAFAGELIYGPAAQPRAGDGRGATRVPKVTRSRKSKPSQDL